MGTLWNTYAFFVLYAEIDQFDGSKYPIDKVKLTNMDKWIISEFNKLVREVDAYLADYVNTEPARLINEFSKLPGVGKKTANVVYSVWFGGDAIAVDTHVFRVSNRLGLAKGKTPLEVEENLYKVVPKENWSKAHHWLIYHGRRVCHSQRPACEECTLSHLCDYYKKK